MQHRISCYGDLTPGIPGVVDTKPAKRLGSLLPDNFYKRSGDQELLEKKDLSPDLLVPCFACLRLHTGIDDLKAALAVARDFSPRVMTASEREVLVDISGLGRLIGPPDEIARQLAHAMFDARLAVRVAVGPTQTVARVLAQADGASHPASSISHLPVHLLESLEATRKMHDRDRARPYETFERWGIVTLGDLAALPAAELSSRLGRRGVALQQLARGVDLRPFVPDRETRRFVERLELEWPIDNLEPLSFVLARLLEPLSDALERADRGAVAIRLELRLTDRSTFARVLPLPVPMRDPRVLRTLIGLALESNPPSPLRGFDGTGSASAGIDVVSIELDPAPARIVRYSLLDRALPSPETLATLTARLSALVGESRVGSAALVDSHQPDALEMTRFAPEDSVSARSGAAGADRAEGADRAKGAVLRRWRTSVALRVSVERGRPVHVAGLRRSVPYGAIVQAAGPWRTSGHWWAAPGAGGRGLSQGAGWNRDEWDVELKSGAVCRIYRDRSTERWFLEAIYD